MTKKRKVEEEAQEEEVKEEEEEVEQNPTDPTDELDTSFDLEDEYKPEPLLSSGNYRGNVIGVTYDGEKSAIVWQVALDGNGGVMSDGETPIDGSHHYYRNWLPKPGDEDEPTKDGRSNKRQSKINMLKRFADEMKINMNTFPIILESITDQDWIGLEVITTISINEYMGTTRNQIDKMVMLQR
jgi:hypothetical protein